MVQPRVAFDLFRTLIIGSVWLCAVGCGGDSNAGPGGGGTAASGGRAGSAGSTTGGGSGGAATAGTGSGNAPSGGSGVEFVGNITTGFNNGMDQGSRKFSTYWDQVTPENAGKWGSVQSNVGASFNWSALDAIYDYAEKNQIVFKQHTFVWGSQQPGGNVTPDAVQKWMSEFCKRYPNTKLIDVVNEPPPHTKPSYDSAIGGGTDGDWKWIANAFTWARAACPKATLILNDYNNIEWPNDNAHFIDIVKKVQAALSRTISTMAA
jgi:endo-1,4-beta-xylanase